MLGAQGVQMGTRFLSAYECTIHPEYKKKILKATDLCTMVTGKRLGHPVRSLRTQFARDYQKAEYGGMPDDELEALGGKAIPLKVRGAFHSPFMNEAAEGFAKEIAKAEVRPALIPLYSNMTAEIYGDNVTELLSKQICNPVQWEKIIRNMISAGVDTFIEIGPGRTLTNMIRKIDMNAKAANYMDYISDAEEDGKC